MFFKVDVLKNFAILESLFLIIKLLAFFYRTPRVAASEFFWAANTFLQLNVVIIDDSRTDLMELQTFRPATLLKTDSNVFLWNLRNF